MRFRQNIFKGSTSTFKASVGFILLLFIMAFFGKLVTNDVPIFASFDGWSGFPMVEKPAYLHFLQTHQGIEANFKINPLFQYASTTIDYKHTLSAPLTGGHLLGTDNYSRDVFAGLLNGSKIALWVGLFSNVLAMFIALLLGSLAGFYSKSGLQFNRLKFIIALFLEIVIIYYFWMNPYVDSILFKDNIYFLWLSFLLINIVLFIALSKLKFNMTSNIRISIDILIMKLIEIIQSVPGLLFLLAIASLIGTLNIFKLSLLIGFFRWPSMTRLVRGEVIKLKQETFIESAKALGLKDFQIILKHILPNIKQQLMVAFAFGVGSSILLEASLSFIGLGLPPDEVSWGLLLSQARSAPNAWWLAVFPGLLISLTIFACYTIGNYQTKKVDSNKEEALILRQQTF